MKKLFLTIIFISLSYLSFAQVPFFRAETGLNSDIYAYTSAVINTSPKSVNNYSTVQFKVGKSVFLGLDFSTATDRSYLGIVFRLARDYSPYFNFSLQVTPSFLANRNMELEYTNTYLHFSGAITSDQKLFWISNTKWFSYNFKKSIFTQYTFLGYDFDVIDNLSLTPLIGESHQWNKFEKIDLLLGLQAKYAQKYSLHLCLENFIEKRSLIKIGISAMF